VMRGDWKQGDTVEGGDAVVKGRGAVVDER
jgi:hypothetical protein